MNWMNPDNAVHIFLNKIGDIIIANLLFIACSVPLITIGPALTALYHCMLRTVKGNQTGVLKTFFRAFRQNFRQSSILWIGLCASFLIVSANLRFLSRTNHPAAQIFFLLSCGLLALSGVTALYVFPVVAAFEGTLKMHLKNSLLFAFTHMTATFLAGAFSTVPMVMTYLDRKLLPLYACCWFFFGFGLTAYLNSLLFYRMFRPWLEQD